MTRKDGLVLAVLALAVLVLRFSALSRTVLDWDESSWLLAGQGILRGQSPYAVSWEHGPQGLAVLFAAAQLLFGQSVLSIRLLTWLAVTLEAFLLYRLGGLLGRAGAGAGVIAAVLYAVLSLTSDGWAAHRELFLAPLLTAALLLLLTAGPATALARRAGWHWLAAGLLLGFGLQLKYLYVFDVAAIGVIGLVALARGWQNGIQKLVARTWTLAALLLAGGLAAWAIEVTAFLPSGDFSEYVFGHFTASAAYSGAVDLSLDVLKTRIVQQLSHAPLLWLSLALTPIYLFAVAGDDSSRRERRALAALVVWTGVALVDAVFTKRLWLHYFLVLLPPLCLLAGLLITGLIRPDDRLGRARRVLALVLLVGAPLVPVVLPAAAASAGWLGQVAVRGTPAPQDAPATVAAYLRAHTAPDDTIYIADYEPIVYYLAGRRAATRYAFPPLLIDEQFAAIDRIDPLAELDAILAGQPRYVVRVAPPSSDLTNAAFAAALDQRIAANYRLEHTVPATDTFTDLPITVHLYRLKDD